MSMDSDLPIAGILTEIKQQLDPAYTYLFLEMLDQNESNTAFSLALSCVKKFPRGNIYWQIYRDAVTKLLFLMVKLHPDCEEQFIQHILVNGLNKDFKLSWFKARS